VVKRARGEFGQYDVAIHDEPESKSPRSPVQFWKGKGQE